MAVKKRHFHCPIGWHEYLGHLSGTFQCDAAGTFQTATDGTFQCDTAGTFQTATAGTFQCDTGGTLIPTPSLILYLYLDFS